MPSKKRAFVLIELLIVLSLIAAVSLPIYRTAQTYLRSNNQTTSKIQLQKEGQVVLETLAQAVSSAQTINFEESLNTLAMDTNQETEVFSFSPPQVTELKLGDLSFTRDPDKTEELYQDDRLLSSSIKSLEFRLLTNTINEDEFSFDDHAPHQIQGLGISLVLEEGGVKAKIQRDVLLLSTASRPGFSPGDLPQPPEEPVLPPISPNPNLEPRWVNFKDWLEEQDIDTSGLDNYMNNEAEEKWTKDALKDWAENVLEQLEDELDDLEDQLDEDEFERREDELEDLEKDIEKKIKRLNDWLKKRPLDENVLREWIVGRGQSMDDLISHMELRKWNNGVLNRWLAINIGEDARDDLEDWIEDRGWDENRINKWLNYRRENP